MVEQAPLFSNDDEPRAHARRSDPETSHEAARSVKKIRQSQAAVLELLRRAPRTQQEMFGAYPFMVSLGYPRQSESGLRTRCKELVDKELVRDSGEKRLTRAGRKSIVWEIMP